MTADWNKPREEWLVRYLKIQAMADPRIAKMLKDAAKDAAIAAGDLATKGGIGANVRRGQLLKSQSALYRILHGFWNKLEVVISEAQERAAREAHEAAWEWDEVLLERVYSKSRRAAMKNFFMSQAERNVEAMIARVFKSRISLSEQVYKTEALANEWLEREINSALATGASAYDLSRRVRRFIRPDTPGGVSYAAKRLSRSEINNAFHAQSVADNEDKPWNTGMKWRLSASHSEIDICDVMANTDQHDLGAGIFPINQVPRKPHPFCFCFVTPETVEIDDFISQFNSGAYDAWIDSTYEPEAGSPGRTVA